MANTKGLFLLARIFVSGIFLCGFYGKLTLYQWNIDAANGFGMPFVEQTMPLAMVVELIGAILLILNRYTWAVCIVLAGFVMYITPFFHFNAAEFMGGFYAQLVQVFKNLSIIGGLLMIYLADDRRPAFLRKFEF